MNRGNTPSSSSLQKWDIWYQLPPKKALPHQHACSVHKKEWPCLVDLWTNGRNISFSNTFLVLSLKAYFVSSDRSSYSDIRRQMGEILLAQTLSLFSHQKLTLSCLIWSSIKAETSSGFKTYNPAHPISNWYRLSSPRDQFEIAGFCQIDCRWIEKQQQTKPAFPFDTNLAPPSLPCQTTLLPQTQDTKTNTRHNTLIFANKPSVSDNTVAQDKGHKDKQNTQDPNICHQALPLRRHCCWHKHKHKI